MEFQEIKTIHFYPERYLQKSQNYGGNTIKIRLTVSSREPNLKCEIKARQGVYIRMVKRQKLGYERISSGRNSTEWEKPRCVKSKFKEHSMLINSAIRINEIAVIEFFKNFISIIEIGYEFGNKTGTDCEVEYIT